MQLPGISIHTSPWGWLEPEVRPILLCQCGLDRYNRGTPLTHMKAGLRYPSSQRISCTYPTDPLVRIWSTQRFLVSMIFTLSIMKTTFVKKSAGQALYSHQYALQRQGEPISLWGTSPKDRVHAHGQILQRGEWPDPTAFAHPLILAGGKNRVWITSAKFYSMTFLALERRCYFEFVGGFIYSSLAHFHIQFQALRGSKVNQTTMVLEPWSVRVTHVDIVRQRHITDRGSWPKSPKMMTLNPPNQALWGNYHGGARQLEPVPHDQP